jgi:glycosyltransferase involved in cell wall biosynthesis
VCYETFGIVLIEAFSHRTPVIARRVGPFPEIVSRSGGGELFDTPGELQTALERFQQPAYRDALGASGYDAYRRWWCESAVLSDYLALVESARERRSARLGLRTDAERT